MSVAFNKTVYLAEPWCYGTVNSEVKHRTYTCYAFHYFERTRWWTLKRIKRVLVRWDSMCGSRGGGGGGEGDCGGQQQTKEQHV